MTDRVEVHPDITVSSRVVARACALATREIDGVVTLPPTVSTVVSGFAQRVGELLSGREAGGPIDGVELSVEHLPSSRPDAPARDDEEGPRGASQPSARVHAVITVGIAGRQAAAVAAEIIRELPSKVKASCGVSPAVSVRIAELVPGTVPDRHSRHEADR